MAEYAGKVVCNCVPGYRDGVELRITGAELLEINGITLTPETAAEIWSWLATNKHMVGKIVDFCAKELENLKKHIGKKTIVKSGDKQIELEIVDVVSQKPNLYRLVFPGGGMGPELDYQAIEEWATALQPKEPQALEELKNQPIHPNTLALIRGSMGKKSA